MMSMPVMKAQTALDIKGPITQEKMIARYGEPDSLEVWHFEDGMGDLYEHYYYGDDYFEVIDGELIRFDINSNRFALYKDIIDGGVKVGDPVEKILNSSHVKKKEKNSQYHVYELWIAYYDYPLQVGMDESETYITGFYYYYIM